MRAQLHFLTFIFYYSCCNIYVSLMRMPRLSSLCSHAILCLHLPCSTLKIEMISSFGQKTVFQFAKHCVFVALHKY